MTRVSASIPAGFLTSRVGFLASHESRSVRGARGFRWGNCRGARGFRVQDFSEARGGFSLRISSSLLLSRRGARLFSLRISSRRAWFSFRVSSRRAGCEVSHYLVWPSGVSIVTSRDSKQACFETGGVRGALVGSARGRCILRCCMRVWSWRQGVSVAGAWVRSHTVKGETIVLGMHLILGMTEKSVVSTQTFRHRPLPHG